MSNHLYLQPIWKTLPVSIISHIISWYEPVPNAIWQLHIDETTGNTYYVKNVKNYIRCNKGLPRILKHNMDLRWRYIPNDVVIVIDENEYSGIEYYLKYDNGRNQLYYDGDSPTPSIPLSSIGYLGHIAILYSYVVFNRSSHEDANEYLYHTGYSSVRNNPLNPTVWEKAIYYKRGEKNILCDQSVSIEHHHSIYDLYRVFYKITYMNT